ncbi:MAG: hypothetical protein KDD02_01735 [Phaeodactylibacter sp.]|nr:hypothetical protein [Phaeodactylibacter sp.]MCB9300608.1 hypothetical protein [Lewinellaceae bacterium]HQU58529.1 cytochrome c peroxidase [Saprospiraceae bacterium]
MSLRLVFAFFIEAALVVACTPEGEEPILSENNYELAAPAHFPKLGLPEYNPQTLAGVELGRRLFYDPILSADSSLSCASCHLQEHAFTDGQAIAIGIDDKPGRRNSPSLANSAYYYKGLFWDGRAATLEEQALIPVEDPNELGNSWAMVEQALRRHPFYPTYFSEAFGIGDTAQITRELAARAIAQFERSLISADAKYDRVLRGEASFTPSEKRGRDIFFDASETLPAGECSHCHTPPLFTDHSYMNNGLDSASRLEDFSDTGRGATTGQRYDNGRFRVPSLRNLTLTAPYMHDGRFATMEEVVEHYNRGGHYAENVDPKIRNLHLSVQDKEDLIAFLRTLTDSTFVNHPGFSNPFKP